MEGIKGKVAVVTGAAKGIGRAIALRLAKEGADIVINYRTNSDSLSELVSEIESFGSKVITVRGDVSVFEDAKNIIDKAVEAFGTVDILVNNAGITRDGLILRMKEEDFDKVIEVNLKGAFNCIRHVSPIMVKKRSGRIINISSVTAKDISTYGCAYSATKAGLSHFSESLFSEVRKTGVKVVCIHPDMTKSNFYRNANFSEDDTESDFYIRSEIIGDVVKSIVTQSPDVVITDITIRPQKHRIKRK